MTPRAADVPPPPSAARVSSEAPTVIGWREYVELPEWGIRGLQAKADTGARTSAIDVHDLVELEGGGVRFDVVVRRRPRVEHVLVEAEIVRRTSVRSSFGAAHDRYVVATTLRLGPVEKKIELSLVGRHHMLCRMLLGRQTLEPEFLVDPGRRYLFGRSRRRKQPSGNSEPPFR